MTGCVHVSLVDNRSFAEFERRQTAVVGLFQLAGVTTADRVELAMNPARESACPLAPPQLETIDQGFAAEVEQVTAGRSHPLHANVKCAHIGACSAMPHTQELTKLRDAVLGDRYPASVVNRRLQRIEEALALAPTDPFFLWARIAELRWFARQDQSCEWMGRSEGEERLDDSLARAFAVLERREDAHADLRALSRGTLMHSHDQVSRFYGLPITPQMRAASVEGLTGPSSGDLVNDHLRINYSYFGAIDKTLSGFFILDSEGDNYTLLDVRGDGRVWWQDHETRELYPQFDSLEDWTSFTAEVAAGGDEDKLRDAYRTGRPVPEDTAGPTWSPRASGHCRCRRRPRCSPR